MIEVWETCFLIFHSRTCGNGAWVRCSITHLSDWSLGDLSLHKGIPAHAGMEPGSDAQSRICEIGVWDTSLFMSAFPDVLIWFMFLLSEKTCINACAGRVFRMSPLNGTINYTKKPTRCQFYDRVEMIVSQRPKNRRRRPSKAGQNP